MPSEKRETPFSCFFYERARKNGCMKNEVKRLYPIWQVMSDDERRKYKERAEFLRGKQGKRDCTGMPLSEVAKEEEERIREEMESRSLITNLVENLHARKELLKESFYVICITHYVCDEDVYYPAEVGVCCFSHHDGVYDSYSKILPGNLPIGSRYEVQRHTEATHHIPYNLPEDLKEESKYFREEFKEFFSSQNRASKVIYLFTQNAFLESVESMIQDFNLSLPFKIYSLDCLLHQIHSRVVGVVPESCITSVLKKSSWELYCSIACQWHQQEGSSAVEHCALTYVKRWIFNMFNSIELKKALGITPLKGKHFIASIEPTCLKPEKLSTKSVRRKDPRCKDDVKKCSSTVNCAERFETSKSVYTSEAGDSWKLNSAQETFDSSSTKEFPTLGESRFRRKKM